MTVRRGPRGDAGAVTVEAAIAIASIVTVVVLCVGAIAAVSTQVRAVDAAREAARLAARGDRANAVVAADRVAPSGAEIAIRDDGAFVVATVRTRPALFPLVELAAEAVAAKEPEGVGG